MSGDDNERIASTLKGWLSEIYYPALLDGSLGPLAARLGGRATVDDPIVGRASGLPEIEKLLAASSSWLRERGATYERTHFVTGIDRDVTEGLMSLRVDEKAISLPVAVVSERRRSREVEIRVYHATKSVGGGTPRPRAPLVPQTDEVPLPKAVLDHVEAIQAGKLDAVLACFEATGSATDSRAVSHMKEGGGLAKFYEQRFGSGRGGGSERQKGGSADDGRTCAVEFTITLAQGREISPRPALAVYERGDSGLLRSLRLYEELD